MNKVPKGYLYTGEEIRHRELVKELFKEFDHDCSGRLDAEELLDLYTSNEVPV